MGSANFSYTEADHLAANRLHARVTLRSWKALRAVLLLWAFYAVLAIAVMAISGLTPVGFALALCGSLAVTLIVATGIRATGALLLPRRSRRLFQQQKVLHGQMFAQWDAESIRFELPNGSTRYAWSDFLRWAEGPDGISLYQNEMLYNLLPKRVLSEGAQADIRAALDAHGVPKAG